MSAKILSFFKECVFYMTFSKGFKDGLPIALGYFPVAFAFGMLALKNGFPFLFPIITSMVSFTGTGQFVGVELAAASAAYSEIFITIMIINIRYLLMSLSLSQKIDESVSLPQRLLIAFGNTDEVFAVAMQQQKNLNFSYMCGLIFSAYIGWVGGTVCGAAAGSSIPEYISNALSITIYAMFIAIIVPPAKKSRPVLVVVLLSIILSCILRFVPPFSHLSSGWTVIICGVAASAAGTFLNPMNNE